MPHPDHPIPRAARQLYHQVRRNNVAIERLKNQIAELEQANVDLNGAARQIDNDHGAYRAVNRRPMGVTA